MHAFAIISNSQEAQQSEYEKILKKFSVSKFARVIINKWASSIKDIRNAQRILNLATQKDKIQALVIESIQQLSLEAQQSLLKTIEEPPANTIIIIQAQNQEQILPTILSRVQVIYKPAYTKITQEEEKLFTSFWAKIITTKSLSQRLTSASQLTSGLDKREQLVLWLDKQIIFFRNILHKRIGQLANRNSLTPSNISTIIKILLFSKKYAQANVNTKLLIDHLFIHLPAVNQ